MQIIGLTLENANDYSGFLTADIAELIGRDFVCGFVLVPDEDEKPVAGIVWELGRGKNELETYSHILFIKAKDAESAKLLLEEYTETVVYVECNASTFELATSLGSVEKKALEEAGFAIEEKEGSVVSIMLADLGMTLLKGTEEADENLRPISEADEREFGGLIARFDLDDNRGSLEDLPYLPRTYFDEDISCYIAQGEQIGALALFHKKPSKKVEVCFIAALEEAEATMEQMVKEAVIHAEEKLDPPTKFLFNKKDEDLFAFIKKNFPKAKGAQVLYGFRKEELPKPEEEEPDEDIDDLNEDIEYDDFDEELELLDEIVD